MNGNTEQVPTIVMLVVAGPDAVDVIWNTSQQ